MKILIIHNEYQQRGGEFQAVKNQIELLEAHGFQVIVYTKDNREINSYSNSQLVRFIPETIFSRKSYDEIREIIEEENPDIAHVHNVFPMISPSVYYALNNASVPIVQTLHNFRFLCPNGLFFVNKKICELCKFGNTSYAILKKCFRESFGLSFLYALDIGGHRLAKTFDLIDRFIVLTEFSALKLIESRLAERKKISILGNFIPSPLPEKGGKNSREDYLLYIGRLSTEKGVQVLLKAGQILDSTKILILGEGPEQERLQKIKAENGLNNIFFLGHVSGDLKWEYMRKASAIVIPSICYETFSLVAIEAMSIGTPVMASKLGSLPYVIDDGKTGLLFEPGDYLDLAKKLSWMVSQPGLVEELGEFGRIIVEEKYNQTKHLEKLINIYEEVLI